MELPSGDRAHGGPGDSTALTVANISLDQVDRNQSWMASIGQTATELTVANVGSRQTVGEWRIHGGRHGHQALIAAAMSQNILPLNQKISKLVDFKFPDV